MANILITGFERFGQYLFNPSSEVARYMNKRTYNGDKVISALLFTMFKEGNFGAPGFTSKLIDEFKPHLVLSLGLSKAEPGTRREYLNLETRGSNIMHGKDANGYVAENEVITPDGPEFYETMFALNGEELVKVLAENGVRARTSDDGARYVCNALIYKTAEKISREGLETKFGFIHMPWIDRYVMPPSSSQGSPEKYTVPEGKAVMPLEEVVKGLELIIERA